MRVTRYTTHYDSDRKCVLVKESSCNYVKVKNLDSSVKIGNLINDLYHASSLTEEYIWMIALNNRCQLIGVFEISHGTVNMSLTSPREIFIRLCLCGATSFVLVHNHPSGNVIPSKEDNELTNRLKNAGEIMGIQLLDHIIIGNSYYSFYAENHRIGGISE